MAHLGSNSSIKPKDVSIRKDTENLFVQKKHYTLSYSEHMTEQYAKPRKFALSSFNSKKKYEDYFPYRSK